MFIGADNLEEHVRQAIQNQLPAKQQPESFKSIPLQDNPSLQPEPNKLPPELSNIFNSLFNSHSFSVKMNQILPFKPVPTPIACCTTLITPKATSFVCFDCRSHPDCLICEQCFRKGNHKGHRIKPVKVEGYCDCGNFEAIKPQGFCCEHSGKHEKVEIAQQDRLHFELVMKQMFIWGFKVLDCGNKSEGQNFLLSLINYLLEMTQNSRHYVTLTSELMIRGQHSILKSLIPITLAAQNCKELTKSTLLLIWGMRSLQSFKEKVLISLFELYNTIDDFEHSKYAQHMLPALLSESEVVEAAVEHSTSLLQPSNSHSSKKYYQTLLHLKNCGEKGRRIFFERLLFEGVVNCRYLKHLMTECYINQKPIIEVFTEHLDTEYLYYRCMFLAISSVEDSQVLAQAIRRYYQLINLYWPKFGQSYNNIILIPQRVFVLLVYKYCHFDLNNLVLRQLAKLCHVQEKQFEKFIFLVCGNFLLCLGQLATSISRTTYFQNYLPLYIRDKGQVVLIDQLGIKMMALLMRLGNHRNSLSQVISKIRDNHLETLKLKKNLEANAQMFRRLNITCRLLIQIVYSPRCEHVIAHRLDAPKQVKAKSLDTLRRILRTVGETTQEEVCALVSYFTGQSSHADVSSSLKQLTRYDSLKRKYIPLESDSKFLPFPLSPCVSLIKTKLSFLITRNASKESIKLPRSAERLKQLIIPLSWLTQVTEQQMELIQDQREEYHLLVTQLIEVLKAISVFYDSQQFETLYESVWQQICENQSRHHKQPFLDHQQLDEIQKQLFGVISKPKEQRKDSQRKQLLRKKKEELMKKNKMKENQQKYIGQEADKQESLTCLICKESKPDNDFFCYLGRAQVSNLLFKKLGYNGSRLIFSSCFHTVHHSCFLTLVEKNNTPQCPLCKSLSNVCFPCQQSLRPEYLERVLIWMQTRLPQLELRSPYKGFFDEGVLYLMTTILLNLETPSFWSEKQLVFSRLIFRLMEASYFMNKGVDRYVDLRFQFLEQIGQGEGALFKIPQIIELMLEIIIDSIEFGKVTTVRQTITPSYIVKNILFTLEKVTFIKLGRTEEDGQNPQQIPKIIEMVEPPSSVEELIELRDLKSIWCMPGHQLMICLVCSKVVCLTCKQVKQHAAQHEPECLLLNLTTSRLYLCSHKYQISLKSLYTNSIGQQWGPQMTTEGFTFDKALYKQMTQKLVNSTLLQFAKHKFKGLSQSGVLA